MEITIDIYSLAWLMIGFSVGMIAGALTMWHIVYMHRR